MSTFAVEIVSLDAVETHTNADALEMAVIGGYRAIVQKGLHKQGDLVVYVPEASLVPEDIIEAFGFTGKLSGPLKNRVKAIRLRGELSQGLVLPLRRVLDVLAARNDGKVVVLSAEQEWDPTVIETATIAISHDPTTNETFLLQGTGYSAVNGASIGSPYALSSLVGQDIADLMGIVKYEPTIPLHMRGVQRPRPEWFPYYTDIENIKKYNRTFEPGEEVVITEKLHGTNFGAGMKRGANTVIINEDGEEVIAGPELFVSSRRVMLKEDQSNLYWRAARETNVDILLRSLLDEEFEIEEVVIFGEVIGHGVQDLAYGHLPGSVGFRWFDLYVNRQYVSEDTARELIEDACVRTGIKTIARVPVLFRGPYSEQVVQDLTDGTDSLSNSHVREGVVVKPVVERQGGRTLNRVILKSISSAYLLRKGETTEFN